MKAMNAAALAMVMALGWVHSAKATDQFLLTWNAAGYTYNDKGQLVVTNNSAKTFIDKVAADNGLNPATLAFVYRVENLDTVVVDKTTGVFIADVYQMENNYTDITNLQNTVLVAQSPLTVEIDTEGDLGNIGSIFGIQEYKYNAAGDLVTFSYHGSFQYTLPGQSVVFSGTFSTGARVKSPDASDAKVNTPKKE